MPTRARRRDGGGPTSRSRTSSSLVAPSNAGLPVSSSYATRPSPYTSVRAVDRPALDALGRDVSRGAQQLLLVAVARGARDTEIGELRDALRVDDDVRGLHVAVDDARGVCRVERAGDLRGSGDATSCGGNGPRSATISRSVLPGTSSMTMNASAPSRPSSNTVDDIGMDDRGRAPRLVGEARAEGIVGVGPEELDATSRSSFSSRARHTSPAPPSSIRSTRR